MHACTSRTQVLFAHRSTPSRSTGRVLRPGQLLRRLVAHLFQPDGSESGAPRYSPAGAVFGPRLGFKERFWRKLDVFWYEMVGALGR